MKEQWCLRVPVQEGEVARRCAIAENILDRTLRPRAENGFLLIPVLSPHDGDERAEFAENHVIEELPRHEQIGGIVVLQDDDCAGAEKILAARPSAHTALFATSPVEGEFRTKTFKVLAGRPTTETIYHEYGRRMKIDLTAAYFSARLANERQRILSQMQPGEKILDMFAGVGPFPVMLGSAAELVIANDLNPGAVLLMQENIRLNHLTNVIPMLGNARNLAEIVSPMKFDRIIMNLPMDAAEFLPAAAPLAKSGTIVHLYSLVEREGEHNADILRVFPGAKITERVLRSYSPTSWHAVYDIEVAACG
ncbi:class I SAM-dependent methyltransferase [Methanocorpusculum vombati]|uniref:Methyltransferase n=1 Tax=Methanocorpusculum vombati TaxID=3002864 RepID=A0ABT4ING9_9EURY|nr:methyltransferase [Methanocorpusculum vombati]MCZ9320370.1 methyltransferase [Methanocorpusculum sp.]MCZ0863312.1 methyltransferase [Methanocorpusculum vombati]MDE2520662.1 methyltransferase [Methanocorpusculum sp.]MDE2533522.1 methyltransferase [Methanocorpusculum sp.]MDE2546430.1 methyltransferase [Methanocorpusculum sp.]